MQDAQTWSAQRSAAEEALEHAQADVDHSRSSLQHLQHLQSTLAASGSSEDDMAKQLAELRSVHMWAITISKDDIKTLCAGLLQYCC